MNPQLQLPRSGTLHKRLGPTALAQIDLMAGGTPGVVVITRIFVPRGHRGKGHGRRLLNRLLAIADSSGMALRLEVASYGPMDHDTLAAWYVRNGFKLLHSGYYQRNPQPVQQRATSTQPRGCSHVTG